MIDPLLSLAFAMQANKGVYALLIGSGVSRAAQIPTGWEVVLDLAQKLAQMQGEKAEPDPAAWYRGKYGAEPDYSKLLDSLAKSPEERDYIRVIVTTNFDRLIERAIEDVGITPTVISTPDAIGGALPLVHQRCCVVKVHGDYLDTRIKNTPEELERYDRRVNRLLDRVLDEFGVVVCGWSAQWDPALRSAFERCKSRRFTLYWASRGKLGDSAERLLKHRAGTLISISDADRFFSELSEKVIALEETQRPHPLSIAAAAAAVKRLMAEERHRIRLHDLVREETDRAFASICEIHKEALAEEKGDGRTERLFNRYFDAVAILRELMTHGCRWAQAAQYATFTNCIPQLARDPERGMGGYKIVPGLRAAPAAMIFYAGGLAAVAGRNYGMLAHLMMRPICRDDGKEGPFVAVFDWDDLHRFAMHIPGANNRYAAGSLWLFKRLRDPLRPLLPDDAEYEAVFDRFEYLLGLIFLDLWLKRWSDSERVSIYAPVGLFRWRERWDGDRRVSIMVETAEESTAAGSSWELLRAGLFDGSAERFQLVKQKYDEMLGKRDYL